MKNFHIYGNDKEPLRCKGKPKTKSNSKNNNKSNKNSNGNH